MNSILEIHDGNLTQGVIRGRVLCMNKRPYFKDGTSDIQLCLMRDVLLKPTASYEIRFNSLYRGMIPVYPDSITMIKDSVSRLYFGVHVYYLHVEDKQTTIYKNSFNVQARVFISRIRSCVSISLTFNSLWMFYIIVGGFFCLKLRRPIKLDKVNTLRCHENFVDIAFDGYDRALLGEGYRTLLDSYVTTSSKEVHANNAEPVAEYVDLDVEVLDCSQFQTKGYITLRNQENKQITFIIKSKYCYVPQPLFCAGSKLHLKNVESKFNPDSGRTLLFFKPSTHITVKEIGLPCQHNINKLQYMLTLRNKASEGLADVKVKLQCIRFLNIASVNTHNCQMMVRDGLSESVLCIRNNPKILTAILDISSSMWQSCIWQSFKCGYISKKSKGKCHVEDHLIQRLRTPLRFYIRCCFLIDASYYSYQTYKCVYMKPPRTRLFPYSVQTISPADAVGISEAIQEKNLIFVP